MTPRTFTAYIEYDPDARLSVGIVPGLPGAHTQGATLDQLRANVQDVVKLCLEEMGDEAADLSRFVGIQQIEIAS